MKPPWVRLLLCAVVAAASGCSSETAPTSDAAVGAGDVLTGDVVAQEAPPDTAVETSAATLRLEFVTPPPSSGPAGQALAPSLQVLVTDADGAPVASTPVTLEATAGGGSVGKATLTSDATGRVQVAWTLGAAPIPNRLAVTTPHAAALEAEVLATLTEAYVSEPFGEVLALLEAEQIDGSTEGLAFDGDQRLVMGIPGGLIEVAPDGSAKRLALSGDPIIDPLGLAYDASGDLWVADLGGKALRRVTSAGAVSTRLTEVAGAPLELPNAVAINADNPTGAVWLSDPCRAAIVRYDAVADAATLHATFDVHTQGGPNGVALSADGATLWVATENVALFCTDLDAELENDVAGLFRVSTTSPGPPVAVGERLGIFGDGVALDIDGNVYAIFDQREGFALTESAVWVLPLGGTTLTRVVKAPEERVLANIAFGRGAYGNRRMYLSLLAFPPLVPDASRGLMTVDVGIEGAPLGR